MNKLQEEQVYSDYANSLNQEFETLSKELNCSVSCAMDVWYLRTRSRWTQQLEEQLIQLHKEGKKPNMCEFGCI